MGHTNKLLEVFITDVNILTVMASHLFLLYNREKQLKDYPHCACSDDTPVTINEKHSQPPVELTVHVHHGLTQPCSHDGLVCED